jgi:tetratricopeptide (TPR) repeat protein
MKRLFLLFILLQPVLAPAQILSFYVTKEKADSLVNAVAHSKGPARVDALNELSRQFTLNDPSYSLQCSQEALAFARAIDYPAGRGMAYLNSGNYFYYTDEKIKALKYYYAALPLLEQTEPSRSMGTLMYYIGLLNIYLMNYEHSKSSLNRSLSNFRILKDSLAIMDVLGYLRGHYLGIPDIQSDTTKPVEQDSSFIRNEVILGYYYRHPGSIPDVTAFYCNNLKGDLYLGRKDPKAVQVFEHSLEMAGKVKKGNEYLYASAYMELSKCYTDIYKNDRLAVLYLHKALAQEKSLFDIYNLLPDSYYYLGLICYRQKNIQKSIDYLLKAHQSIEFAIENQDKMPCNPHALIFFRDAYKGSKVSVDSMLSIVYQAAGDFRNAFLYFRYYTQAKDNLEKDKTNLRVSRMQTEMELENAKNQLSIYTRESEVKALKITQMRLILSGLVLLSLLLTLFLVSRHRRKRLKLEQKSLVLEQKLLRSQMNPHFIFNSLASIQNFIINEKPGQASIFLSRFSKLIRNILDNSVEELVPLEKEIETVRNYLELQKVRYSGKFEFSIYLDPSIDPEFIYIPPMLAQPFIENSIEHGIKYLETTGHINISFTMDKNMILFMVADDGVGREKAMEIEISQHTDHRSMATSITKDRLNAMNKKHGKRIIMEITDLRNALGNACGTRVSFAIPAILK